MSYFRVRSGHQPGKKELGSTKPNMKVVNLHFTDVQLTRITPQIHLLFFQLTQITLVLEQQMSSSKMKIWCHGINEGNKEMEMFYMKM